MAKMNHVIIYGNYEEAMSALSDAQVGRVIRGLLHMLNTGEEFKPKGMERYFWPLIRDQFLRNLRKYEEVCERNRSNSQKYWDSRRQEEQQYLE